MGGAILGSVPGLIGIRALLSVNTADLNSILKEGGSRGGCGCRQNKARTVPAIGEIALAIVLVGVAAGTAAAFGLARLIPAIRATRIDPMKAMRYE